MNNGAYAGLRRAPRAAMPDPENDELPEDESAEGKDKETNMDKTHTQADVDQAAQAAASAAAKAANERFSTVLASEHYAGRETLAHSLLAKDVLSAADIIETLQAAEKKTAPEASADEGSTMLANMRAGADVDLGTEGGDELDAKAENYGWAKAHAKIAKMRGHAAR